LFKKCSTRKTVAVTMTAMMMYLRNNPAVKTRWPQ